jgi:nudix-type nucleoside diphosphatase (YffH/AdpP family)
MMGPAEDADGIRTVRVEELARTSFSVLRRAAIEYRRLNGEWQNLVRETYDHGNGAAILLYDAARDCVLLVRQFRYPVYLNAPSGYPGERGRLVEVPAGMLDDHHCEGRTAEETIRAEAEEEAGVTVASPRHILDAFMSPGSVTERVAFFVAAYSTADRTGAGGGLIQEGEDISIMEPTLDEALAMIERGEIIDAKTIILLYWARLHRADLARRIAAAG